MFKYVKIIFTFLMLALFLACAAGRKAPKERPELIPPPDNLIVESGNQKLDLSWETNRTEDMMISGYNIYISEEPLTSENNLHKIKSGIEPFNQTPYPGDENPEVAVETFTAENLTNGVKYYVGVTTVFPDQSESRLSNVVEITCYPRGIVTVKDRMMGDSHGFSFSLDQHVDYNALENDLYFIARDIGNMIGSPDRNEGVLKHTEFASLGRTRVLDDSRNFDNLDFRDRIFVSEGNAYAVRLNDGSMVKILVKQVDSSAYKKQVVFEYIYLGY